MMSQREYCVYCGRSIPGHGAHTDDGFVHLGCQGLTNHSYDARPGRMRGLSPDFDAPSLAQQEYIRKTAHCYATLFHKPDKCRRVREKR